MIQPIYIKYEVCPDCGAPWHQLGKEITHRDGSIRRHINGGVWEYVSFTCGRKDKFIPNFNSIQTESLCTRTPEMKAQAAKRKKALDDLQSYIRQMDVDESFRERIYRDYRFFSLT